MSCFEFCCPTWCKRKSESSREREPLIKRRDTIDKVKDRFQTFRRSVLENSLKDFDAVKEDIRDVTLFLPPTGVGGVDAQLSGYVTLYNDHLERWKNLRILVDDFKNSPTFAKKGVTFRNALSSLHKICDDITTENGDLRVTRVSEFCLLIDYRPIDQTEDKSARNQTIVIFNQINRDLREFIERGPSLARLLKSISCGIRFKEITPQKLGTNKGQTSRGATDRNGVKPGQSDRPSDEITSDEDVKEEAEICRSVERENLDSSISRAGLCKEREEEVMKRYKSNLEMLARGASIVEVLDLAAKSLWQNIQDELDAGGS